MILRYSFKSILFFCFIKAIFPLINYDDEPSVPKGILSQLPSSHLFIHWVPAKLQNRVMPYGENRCQLQLLFLFWLLLTCISTNGTDDSVDAIPLLLIHGLCADVVPNKLRRLRVSYPEPCRLPEPVRSSAGLWIIFLCLYLLIMLPLSPSPFPTVGYLSAVSPDHTLFLSSESYISPWATCRQSLLATASS